MLQKICPQWDSRDKVLIGMCHVPPLPGSPRYEGDLPGLRDRVMRDADALVAGGAAGIFLENFGDIPFFPGRVPALTIAHLAVIANDLRRRVNVPLGINVLRNDGRSALSIAHAVGAAMIRVNVLSHARLTDQGVIQSIAHDLLRERATLNAQAIRICADVNVKESVPLSPGLRIEDETDDLVHRGLADALIVSGANTGGQADVAELRRVRSAAPHTPIFIGSGVTSANVEQFLPLADGFIVGTSLKIDGRVENAVDPARVRALSERLVSR